MLLDPRALLPILPGTRILTEDFGVLGVRFEDPVESLRQWTVRRLFAPLPKRRLGGIRAKVSDQKNFTTFVNQRDLELLLGIAAPGQWCSWQNEPYPYINDSDSGWFGPCCDRTDLLDDLHEHELLLRQAYQVHYGLQSIPSGIDHTRRVHMSRGTDVEELLLFLWDIDTETGLGPDGRLETLERRWKSVESRSLHWTRL